MILLMLVCPYATIARAPALLAVPLRGVVPGYLLAPKGRGEVSPSQAGVTVALRKFQQLRLPVSHWTMTPTALLVGKATTAVIGTVGAAPALASGRGNYYNCFTAHCYSVVQPLIDARCSLSGSQSHDVSREHEIGRL